MGERIALIDFGAGNLRSVHNALRAAGAETIVLTTDADTLSAADRIVLPGVGAFGHCRDALAALPGVIEALEEVVLQRGRPFLGICVGMQLMATRGEEHGVHEGLGWIPGTVRPIDPRDGTVKIPHMGWNDVTLIGTPPLLEPGEAYFLHGYALETEEADAVYATTDHGGPVVAAVGRDTMIGVQFHPEKSQRYGLDFLSRFLNWRP